MQKKKPSGKMNFALLIFFSILASILSISQIIYANGFMNNYNNGIFQLTLDHSSSTTYLTIEQRISCQKEIDKILYKHRIWENKKEKPGFDEAVPEEIIRNKVMDVLRGTNALAHYWNVHIIGEQLQKEIERIVQNTKDPDMLNEIRAALNNNPYLIAECVARPIIVESFLRSYCTSDSDKIRTESKHKKSFDAWWTKVKATFSTIIVEPSYNYRLPCMEEFSSCQMTDMWHAAPDCVQNRKMHTVIWTGAEEIVWGGYGCADPPLCIHANFLWTGGKYNPDTYMWKWLSFANIPTRRAYHTAVWSTTTDEMIIWGGYGCADMPCNELSYLNTGGRYNPATDSWKPTDSIKAPPGRKFHTAVWTGKEMVIRGGINDTSNPASHPFKDRSIYDPVTDSWIIWSD
ncbi:MAG: hypothetical protein A2Y62_13900 [Candidatus Fischerbacteria bacterium RBG_13_37_8]|uniref:Uncharacterized protein n=1 Tax=Candidatus Fischerbacteria bacterium RBG_13_37_8 TaxID=1817863 RepID=A0A1F5VWK3_9BACT|nr:MAG: hypothetical protein A2Y62_13900 [Candidatus Fischerbacteria bacterium RBG_13_37_8]